MPGSHELRALWRLNGTCQSLAQLRKCIALAGSQVKRHREPSMGTSLLIAFIHEQSKRFLDSSSGGGRSPDLSLLDAETRRS